MVVALLVSINPKALKLVILLRLLLLVVLGAMAGIGLFSVEAAWCYSSRVHRAM